MAAAAEKASEFMPMKLKAVLVRHGLRQTDWGNSVRQLHGQPLSAAACALIVNWGTWPAATPRHSIEEQTRAWLREKGVPEDEIATCFELDEAAAAAHPGGPPKGAPLKAEKPAKFREKPAPTSPEEKDPEFLENQMLSPKARRHFKLFRDPFNADPESSEDVFRGPDQSYASECIWEAVRNNRLFALVGESGSGKTTLWDDFKDRVRREDLPVRLIMPMLTDKKLLTGIGILSAIVRDLDPHATLRAKPEMLAAQAHQLLAEQAEVGQHNVIVFEEAHDLTVAALKQLKRLHEMKTGWKRLLSIVLLGQPELTIRLGEKATGEAREVARRLEIVTLLPLDGAGDLEGYIAHRLTRSNSRADDILAPDAYDQIRNSLVGVARRGNAETQVSMCYPLLVNNLIVRAMNAAAELGAPRIDAAIVRAARRGN